MIASEMTTLHIYQSVAKSISQELVMASINVFSSIVRSKS